MEIKNRLFPYPVLCEESDDYTDEFFDVRSRVQERLHDIHIHVEFHVEDNAILDSIRMGYAEYVLHLECSTTSFRKVIKSEITEIDYSILKSRVNVEIAVLAMIVAKRPIYNFVSEKLNEDYSENTINFDKGAILAYKNLPRVYVYKNYEELTGNESLFSIVKVGLPDDEIRPLTFNLNEQRIQILVDAKTYEAYIHYQQKSAIAMSMLVMPALIYMIDELREAPDAYNNRMWFMKMKQFYKAQGSDFIDDIVNGERNVVEIAQEMLKSPIGRAYRDLLEAEEEI